MTKTVAHKLVETLTEQDGEHTSVLPQDVVSATADILESENYRVIHKNPELGGFSKADAKVGFENQHGEYFSIAFDLSEPGHMYLLDDSDSVMADASIDLRAGGHDWKYTIEGMLEQHEADIRKDGEMAQPEQLTEIEDVDIDSDWNKLDRTTRANIFRTLDIPDHIMYDAISKSWSQLPDKLKQRLKAADERGTLSLVAGEPEDTSNGEWDTFSKIESLHKNIQS